MKVRIICDPDWSTGSIAKDLIHLLPHHNMEMHSWRDYAHFPDDQALLCFSLTLTSRWEHTRRKNAIHICCHPHEPPLDEFQNVVKSGTNLFMGGVSRECQRVLQAAVPNSFVHYLPATARSTRFHRRARPGRNIAGFIGRPTAQNIQITGGIKHPEVFSEICRTYGLMPKFSNQDYTYATMQEFYDSIDYLICTSSSEGGPLGPFEAALCGVPVLSTKVGLWGESKMEGYFDGLHDPRIAHWLTNSAALAKHQGIQMQSLCMENLVPLWDSAIRLAKANF